MSPSSPSRPSGPTPQKDASVDADGRYRSNGDLIGHRLSPTDRQYRYDRLTDWDNELTPTTAARASQTVTAVRWAAHGLGVTLVPASAVPHGHEHLARPVFPVVSQPVIAAVRPGAGPAETALLELLCQET